MAHHCLLRASLSIAGCFIEVVFTIFMNGVYLSSLHMLAQRINRFLKLLLMFLKNLVRMRVPLICFFPRKKALSYLIYNNKVISLSLNFWGVIWDSVYLKEMDGFKRCLIIGSKKEISSTLKELNRACIMVLIWTKLMVKMLTMLCKFGFQFMIIAMTLEVK